jgi:hypothetical protein
MIDQQVAEHSFQPGAVAAVGCGMSQAADDGLAGQVFSDAAAQLPGVPGNEHTVLLQQPGAGRLAVPFPIGTASHAGASLGGSEESTPGG